MAGVVDHSTQFTNIRLNEEKPKKGMVRNSNNKLYKLLLFIHSFYIALFSALKQTCCTHWHVILNE